MGVHIFPSITLHEKGPHNPYPGGLHTPQFNIFIQSQGRNHRPGADHHYLAEETESPAVMHGNISQSAAVKLLEYQADNSDVHHAPLPKCEKRDVVVCSPKDPTLSRKFRVAIFKILQTILSLEVQERRGHTMVSAAEIA